MFGYTTLFRSRWAALLWAAGILYFAYTFAGDAGDGPSAGEANQASNALNAF
jgi:hypothetical protein